MKQFDRQLRNSFIENLDSVHASEDLIAATLRNINLEGEASSTEEQPSGHYSAINTRFVRNHIKAMEKNTKHNRLIKRGMISAIAIAAAVLLVSGIALNAYNLQSHKEAKTIDPSSIPYVSYVTFEDAYINCMQQRYANMDYSYSYTNSSGIANDSINASHKDRNEAIKVERHPNSNRPELFEKP